MVEIRPITDDEIPAYRDAMLATFAGDPDADPAGTARIRALIPTGRAIAAFDRGQCVATSGTYPLRLTVPGGALPIAGLTQVSVRPTHRRRGLLRALIDAHLADARAHGEPVSGLWASEASIYGRFGYGIASHGDALTFDARHVTVGDPAEADDVRIADDATARAELPALYARCARPGCYDRSPAWWEHRRLVDLPHLRGDATARRHAIAWRGDQPTGYVAFRQRQAWVDGLPDGSYDVDELIALDPRAEITLWRYAAGIDLFPRVTWWHAPVDTVLPWIVDDPRRIQRRRHDGLWLRIADVPAALAARRYAADGALVLDVDGAVVALRSDGGVATCAPADAAADLRVERAALGAIYLGGVPASRLAAAGRIAGAPAALALADRMFGWPIAPWCAEIF